MPPDSAGMVNAIHIGSGEMMHRNQSYEDDEENPIRNLNGN